MNTRASAKPSPEDLRDHYDRAVDEFEETFRGIEIAGVDLASVSRLPLYISLKNHDAFAAPSLLKRALFTLLTDVVFMRERLKGTPAPLSAPAPHPSRPLFFFEVEDPSVRESLLPVLAQFGAEEARAATTYSPASEISGTHEWVDMQPFIAARAGGALKDFDKSFQNTLERSGNPLYGRASFRAWMRRAAIRLAGAAPAVRALFEDYPATVLVTASDASFWGRCATLEATRRGIPSLTLQHGLMAKGISGYVPVVSTRFAAWGEASARWLQARAVPAEKIVVTGAPRLDEIVNRTPASRETVAGGLGIDAAPRWVVLATNPIAFAHNALLLEAAREGVRAWGVKAVLIVKLHPSEDPAPYRAAVAGDAGVVIVPHGQVHLYDLLAAADAVLTFHSSVGLEAMLLDRPVISLEAFGEENPVPYAREDAAAVARSAEELAEVLRQEIAPGQETAAREEKRSQFIRDNLHAADGKSARRIRDLIRSLAAGGSA